MAGTLLVVVDTFAEEYSGPDHMRFGLGIEVDPEDIDLQNIVPGVPRPGFALTDLYIHPEGPFDCCTQSQAAGYMLALLLLLLVWACQPHVSLSHRLWETVL